MLTRARRTNELIGGFKILFIIRLIVDNMKLYVVRCQSILYAYNIYTAIYCDIVFKIINIYMPYYIIVNIIMFQYYYVMVIG